MKQCPMRTLFMMVSIALCFLYGTYAYANTHQEQCAVCNTYAMGGFVANQPRMFLAFAQPSPPLTFTPTQTPAVPCATHAPVERNGAAIRSCITQQHPFTDAGQSHSVVLPNGLAVDYVTIKKENVPRGIGVWNYFAVVKTYAPTTYTAYQDAFYHLNKEGAARKVAERGWTSLQHADLQIPIRVTGTDAVLARASYHGHTVAHTHARTKHVLYPKQLVRTQSIHTLVRTAFRDTPIMVKIAQCESQMIHGYSNGRVLQGIIDPDDIGVMQINRRYHGRDARRMGYNIYSAQGNIAFAKYLYRTQGTRPWKASSPCWTKSTGT